MSSEERARRWLDTLGHGDESPATDDVIAAVMPLFEQVAALHDTGRVAPLEGVEALQLVSGQLFFAGDTARTPRLEPEALRTMETRDQGAFRVARRLRREDDEVVDLDVGSAALIEGTEKLERPVYLPRFVGWEHVLGHHDPLTDLFVLGLVMASVALDEDLGSPDKLGQFVSMRKRLGALMPRIHPVVMRVIVGMTELDRHARIQDLRGVIATLATYRDRDAPPEDLDGDTQREAGTPRRQLIHRRLRDRLFDFSRRNRMLHFRATAATVDMTAASVPLVMDVRSVKESALMLLGGESQKALLSGKAFPLSRWLRFEDYPFLAPALDQLRLEARRSRAEVGFSQLRLVLAFLHWHDLVDRKEERITSPLLLLPVEIEKKRGVRDAFTLQATDDRAEVNPVLAQYLRQRYGVTLPERIDLGDAGAIERLHATLEAQIQASQPGVTISKDERPSIDLVLAVARKKLDGYRRKVRLSGRHVRSVLGVDYSYARGALRPLGLQLFETFVSPQPAPDSVLHDEPRPIVWHAAPNVDAGEITRSLYSLRRGSTDAGPFEWSFDLASLTLANFNYRNVSLVRDYQSLIEGGGEAGGAFEEVFREDARPVEVEQSDLELHERHDVVLADPTQAGAVSRARAGRNYVIQGPPGTGKSQTITNLVADFVARGKRVLFVCEKRAALDVVYHRLVQVGLGPLACIVHDAQEDKKELLKDLKNTYEGWLADGATTRARERRSAAIERVRVLLGRAERHARALAGPSEGADLALREVLRRAIALREIDRPTLPEGEVPPPLRDVAAAQAAYERVHRGLASLGHQALGAHPARLLGARALDEARTLDEIAEAVVAIERSLTALEKRAPLVRDRDVPLAMEGVIARLRFAARVRPLVARGIAALLDAGSDLSQRVRRQLAERTEKLESARRAEERSAGWREPLPEDEARTALVLARRFEADFLARLFRWLSPAWWRLRGLLVARFDAGSRVVMPDWSELLELLLARYGAQQSLESTRATLRAELADADPDEVRVVLDQLAEDSLHAAARNLRDELVRHPSDETLRSAIEEGAAAAPLAEKLELLTAWETLEPSTLLRDLAALAQVLPALSSLRGPLRELDAVPNVSRFVRSHALEPRALEALAATRSADLTLRARAPELAIEQGSLDALGAALAEAAAELRVANAEALVEEVRARFVERAFLATSPTAALTPPQRELKRDYGAGRKELEREMGKVMRHKTIRELVSGPAGIVVRDLKRVWLMSPLSVADVLPLERTFDLVVFDEASQIPLQDAVPAIHRGEQCVVVGDRQQLPPTDFFSSSLEEGDDDGLEENVAIDRELDADSLLTHADRTLPSTLLGWHYRSRDESLIDFSNRSFYAGRLLTVPSVTMATTRDPIVARAPDDGEAGAAALLERPISFHRVEGAVYDTRRNVGEARYIAALVHSLLARKTGHTLGIVAFSEAQQHQIERALAERAERHAELGPMLEEESAREDEGQHVGLFVKNLENVQGDERDVIIVSVCYAPDVRGRMIMNFGPINRRGGERRLNVIFSRAKHHVALVSTIGWDRITNDYNDGAACLKTYLRYAEAASRGDVGGMRAALAGAGPEPAHTRAEADPLALDVARALRSEGLVVESGVGATRLRCDLAVRAPGSTRFALGVLLDAAPAESSPDEALRLKPGVLRAFGWTVTTLGADEWYTNRATALARLVEAAAGSSTARV